MDLSFKLIKKLITHPHTALICRMVLGAVFIYASWDKILHPEQFARSVMYYKILPPESVNLLAIILPWLELVCGIFLLLGLFTNGSILVTAFMITVFLVAISSALIRGIDISCGCFSSNGTNRINILYLLRDMTLFAFALQIFLYDRRILSLDNLINRKDFP
jgi:uncharacterized membrane protein YphA (DoxX/SURF4 family)